MRRVMVLLLTGVVFGLAEAGAHDEPIVGRPIRVTYDQSDSAGDRPAGFGYRRPEQATGILLGIDAHRLLVQRDGTESGTEIPLASVDEVWIPDRKSHLAAGALVGTVAGVGIGALIGPTQESCLFACSPAPQETIIFGAMGGFLLGAVIGAAVETDGWKRLSDRQLQLTLAPAASGLHLQARVRF